MSSSVETVVRSLKLRAAKKDNALSVKIGTKKYVLPAEFEVRVLSSADYLFVHIPPAASVMKVTAKGLQTVAKADEAKTAAASFRKTRKKGGTRTVKAVEMPAELKAALSKIPSGFKLAFDASGKPKIVKTRKRRK